MIVYRFVGMQIRSKGYPTKATYVGPPRKAKIPQYCTLVYFIRRKIKWSSRKHDFSAYRRNKADAFLRIYVECFGTFSLIKYNSKITTPHICFLCL